MTPLASSNTCVHVHLSVHTHKFLKKKKKQLKISWADETVQGVRAFDSKSDDLGLTPKTHIMEGENQPLKAVL